MQQISIPDDMNDLEYSDEQIARKIQRAILLHNVGWLTVIILSIATVMIVVHIIIRQNASLKTLDTSET